MNSPGSITRSGYCCIRDTASASILPQVGKSDGNPTPRKLSADSVMIAVARPSVADTMIGDRTFGSRCRCTMRKGVVPMERAARMNSRSLRARMSPRTMRAVGIQLVIAMMPTIRTNMPPSGPKAARRGWRKSVTATSRSGRIGSDRNRSVRRISSPSAFLTKPARTPTVVPMIRLRIIAAQPTAIEVRPPWMIWANWSRPSWSVPKGRVQDTLAELSRSAVQIGRMSLLRMSSFCASTCQINGPISTAMVMKIRNPPPNIAPLCLRNWSHTSFHWLRGGASGPLSASASIGAGDAGRGSVIADSRVEKAVQDIGDQVEHDDEEGENKRDCHYHRQIAGEQRRDEQLAKAVYLEHVLRDDRTAEDGRHVERDDGDDRDHRIAQDVDGDDNGLRQPLGAGGADIILVEVVEHRSAHVATDLSRGLQRQHHYRQDHLLQLKLEAGPVIHDMRRVIDRREPAQLHRENDDEQRAGEERRDRKADHRDESARLIENRILPVGRIDADGQGDQDAHDIRHADNPERLRDALDDGVHDRRPGLPGDHAQFVLVKLRIRQPAQKTAGPCGPVDEHFRFGPEDLHQPFPVLHQRGFPDAKRFAHLLLDLWRDGQRNLRHRVAGGELQKHENDKTDEQKRRNGEDKSSDGKGQHRVAPRGMSLGKTGKMRARTHLAGQA